MESHPRLERIHVEALDAILGIPFQVLDDGFVRVIDYMGSDASVVQAARVSYGTGTKRIHEDRGLIRYLMRHRHTTPFEMCEIKLHVRAPMDCWRQWIRHRTASVNEYSTRYSQAIDAAYRTKADGWRRQSNVLKQGSESSIEAQIGKVLSEEEECLQQQTRAVYEKRIEAGVAREQARKDLPLSTYTEAYWKIDLHNLLHFLELRMDGHAQFEIRSYAKLIAEKIVARWCPLTWEAFLDYRVESQTFSRLEMNLLREILAGDTAAAKQLAEQYGWLSAEPGGPTHHGEREEFRAKLLELGASGLWESIGT